MILLLSFQISLIEGFNWPMLLVKIYLPMAGTRQRQPHGNTNIGGMMVTLHQHRRRNYSTDNGRGDQAAASTDSGKGFYISTSKTNE